MGTATSDPAHPSPDANLDRGGSVALAAQWRALVASQTIGVAVIEANTGRLLEVNPRFAAIVGTAPADLIGRALAELRHPSGPEPEAPEQLWLGAEGQPVHVTVETQPIPVAAGEPGRALLIVQDISALRQSEVARNRSDDRRSMLLESIDQGFCIIEMVRDAAGRAIDYRFLEVNRTFARHTGLVDAQGRTARELVPDLEQQWIDAYGHVAETGEARRFSLGSAAMGRWFEVDAVRAGDPADDSVALLFTDITERIRAEERLRASEEALRTSEQQLSELANAMPQVVWVADPDGVVRYYNDRVRAFAGVRRVADQEWAWLPTVHPDDLDATVAAWNRAVAEHTTYAHEHRILVTGGDYRWHLSRAHPVFDEHGSVVRWLGTATEIHDLKEAERELDRRRQEFASLAEHSPDIVARFDRALRHRYVNSAVEAVTGRSAAEFIGKTNAELGMPPDLVAEWEQHSREVFATGEERRYAFTFPAPDGPRHFWARLVPETTADGAIDSLLSITYEVTDRVRAEQARQALLDALAHDLKNPLAAMRALAQLMLRQLARGRVLDAGTLTERATAFDGMAKRMTEMVDELSDYARLAGQQPADLNRQRTSLVALLREAIAELQHSPGPHVIRLETGTDPLIGTWDPRRLSRMAANLLGNAVKYSPNGGEIVVRLAREGDDALLVVRDQGIGIAATDLPHIFGFHRRGANVGDIAGSGIGLAGSKWIVEQHGGSIAVASELDRGATFTVRLPLDPAPAD